MTGFLPSVGEPAPSVHPDRIGVWCLAPPATLRSLRQVRKRLPSIFPELQPLPWHLRPLGFRPNWEAGAGSPASDLVLQGGQVWQLETIGSDDEVRRIRKAVCGRLMAVLKTKGTLLVVATWRSTGFLPGNGLDLSMEAVLGEPLLLSVFSLSSNDTWSAAQGVALAYPHAPRAGVPLVVETVLGSHFRTEGEKMDCWHAHRRAWQLTERLPLAAATPHRPERF